MNKSNTIMPQNEKKLNLIAGVLMLVGTLISICLVFFFIQLFKARNNNIIPNVFNAKQIGETDTSILLVWNCSDASDEFIVRYRPANSFDSLELRTDKCFAVIHGLEPYNTYKADVIPVGNNTEYEPVSVTCKTSPYCNVTDVVVDNITNNSAHVTWNYKGIDEGFTVAVYAVDKDGKRCLTGEKVTLPKGAINECTFENLLSELCYSVCVMPNTKYATVGKSTFQTNNYSKSYNRYVITRFGICASDTPDTFYVNAKTVLAAGQPYKTFMILSGTAKSTNKVVMEAYITDEEGKIVNHSQVDDVYLNPNDKSDFFYRLFTVDISAPSKPGNYNVFAAIDGVTVRSNKFKVE